MRESDYATAVHTWGQIISHKYELDPEILNPMRSIALNCNSPEIMDGATLCGRLRKKIMEQWEFDPEILRDFLDVYLVAIQRFLNVNDFAPVASHNQTPRRHNDEGRLQNNNEQKNQKGLSISQLNTNNL